MGEGPESRIERTGVLAPGAPAVPALWRVLIVDDEPDIHVVTRLALRNFSFEGRGLEWLSAHTAGEALKILESTPDIALILLDVVMETPRAGLDLAHHIRRELGNRAVRIVLRTGEPDEAPPLSVVEEYAIDDYRNKTELTFERMTILCKTALRTYRLLGELERQGKQLSESNEELRRFSHVASHDMKTPLRGIVSAAQLIERRYAQVVAPRDRELLQFIVQGATDLNALVESLLEFSRVGDAPLEAQPVDLNAVVARALEHLRTTIDERQARVDVEPLPTVTGSAAMLERLFRNLVENGLKFQPGPAPTVQITALALQDGWEIRVADQGIGIESQYLAAIFEPFRRLHTADKFAGSGLGLAICRKIVQMHRGSIRATSTPGSGTTMVVTLPRT